MKIYGENGKRRLCGCGQTSDDMDQVALRHAEFVVNDGETKFTVVSDTKLKIYTIVKSDYQRPHAFLSDGNKITVYQ